ncbi:MAG TPA: hypothetical protein HA255_05515 [Methanosphaera sp.]|nr:hypothetical protein [Methanosphaera sp.]
MEFNKDKVNSRFKNSQKQGLTLNDIDIKGYGNSSIELLDGNIIFKSFQSNNNLSKSVDDIDFLIYSKGNFLMEDRVFMGISGQQFEISTKENEIGLKNFFDSLVKTKGSTYSGNNLLENNLNTIKTNQSNINNSSSIDENAIIFDNSANKVVSDDSLSGNEMESETINVADEIRNFHNLMKDGIISEEEFEEKKKELLKL